jgi:dTDP-4-dehydrorhamnose reductase
VRILVIGRDGQLGQSLREVATVLGVAGWAEMSFIDRETIDFTDRASIEKAVADAGPDVVINAAAYTAVDAAEDEAELAFLINAAGPKALAEVLSERGGRLIHVSTDYVFDGGKATPYVETDAVNPQGVYGKSKAAGEDAVRDTLGAHVIVRTAWLYSPFGQNFVKTMLRLARERDAVSVVADQWGSPTSALELARGLMAICAAWRDDPTKGLGTTYHFAGGGETNWAGLARAVFEASSQVGGPVAEVVDIATADWPAKAKRPLNSRLCCDLFAGTFGYRAPDWRPSVVEATVRIVKETPLST